MPTDSQTLRLKYTARLCGKTQELVTKRVKSDLSQQDMATATGVSLKTIQRFETYRTQNPYLIFAYRYIL